MSEPTTIGHNLLEERERKAFEAGCIFAGDGLNSTPEVIDEAYRTFKKSALIATYESMFAGTNKGDSNHEAKMEENWKKIPDDQFELFCHEVRPSLLREIRRRCHILHYDTFTGEELIKMGSEINVELNRRENAGKGKIISVNTIIYRGHSIEISTISSGWKPYKACFLDLQEKPFWGWTEHDVTEFVKWTIDRIYDVRPLPDPTGRMI